MSANLSSPVPLMQGPFLEHGVMTAAWQQWFIALYGKTKWQTAAAPTASVTLTTAYGTPATALVDVGSSHSQAILNNNFASIVQKTTNLETRVSEIYAALKTMGVML